MANITQLRLSAFDAIGSVSQKSIYVF